MAFNQTLKQFISTPFNLSLLATAAGTFGAYGQGAVNSHTLVGTIVSLVIGALFHDSVIGAGTAQVLNTVVQTLPTVEQAVQVAQPVVSEPTVAPSDTH